MQSAVYLVNVLLLSLHAGCKFLSIQVSAVAVAVSGVLFGVLGIECLTLVVEFLLGYTLNVLDRLGRYCPKIECR